ncbi:HD domain-containing protein [Phnomibacter ginsenosidimutans]|nr:HD domain-containing protein [Phnomibacter ginsenosidimutans]
MTDFCRHMSFKGKIINDPIYGFISIDDPVVFRVVSHPYYQRLRRIYQMAFAHLVYPGAVHTRMAHSLGAYHLMSQALGELQRKGIEITPDEATAAKVAILLHDVGHGPFSHALEGTLVQGVHHETMSRLIMEHINAELNGALDTALAIFNNTYHKPFLHQLVSGQLDVDRMDYLNRDSFFTGVSEGVIGYDRIIKMLTVHNGQLMVEEKAVYSIEKFLVARRLMYWQVYLHKTVLAAEQMLVRIIRRAREIGAGCHPNLHYVLYNRPDTEDAAELLRRFTMLDDVDVMMAIKEWQQHPDRVLATMCTCLLNRNLFKIKLQSEPIAPEVIAQKKAAIRQAHPDVTEEELSYLVFTGEARNTTYKTDDERINILFKDGSVRDISQVDNALIQQSLAATVGKQYICYLSV